MESSKSIGPPPLPPQVSDEDTTKTLRGLAAAFAIGFFLLLALAVLLSKNDTKEVSAIPPTVLNQEEPIAPGRPTIKEEDAVANYSPPSVEGVEDRHGADMSEVGVSTKTERSEPSEVGKTDRPKESNGKTDEDEALPVPADEGFFERMKSDEGGGDAADFARLLKELDTNGLEVVIIFDSTGSMSGEINEVKKQIHRIHGVLSELVPSVRLSLVTYRDHGDEYVVLGTPLSNKLTDLEATLAPVVAAGGGDEPEAVHLGLNWGISRNKFRAKAHKVILLFGDAPPHAPFLINCLNLARNFTKREGVVNTITCRSFAPLPEFKAIADAGGGGAFLTSNEKEIVTQLLVTTFGVKHKEHVLKAYELLGQP